MKASEKRPVAAIDCGTNSTRLLIAHCPGKDLVRKTRITRLGQGVDRYRSLAPDAIQRTLDALYDYRDEIKNRGVTRGRLVATSAVRDATNGPEFLAAATSAIGFDAELLSGDEESRLAFAGATAGIATIEGDSVVIDIGGGSTELIVQRGADLSAVSLDIGSVRLTERCLTSDPPAENEIEAAMATIHCNLDRALKLVPDLNTIGSGSLLLGLAGTVETLAALTLELDGRKLSQTHHTVLQFEAVARWCSILLTEPATARLRRPGMARGREDVICAGALILREVMDRLDLRNCLVSEMDILDGLILSIAGST